MKIRGVTSNFDLDKYYSAHHMMLDFLNDNMHTVPALIYARIRSCFERCKLHIHDFVFIMDYFIAYFLVCTNSKETIS